MSVEILLSDSRGVFIPQHFALFCKNWKGVSAEQFETLERGPEPDNEWYWDTWSEVLDSAYLNLNGKRWTLWQDGDLFAICVETMTDREYEEFFGEEKCA